MIAMKLERMLEYLDLADPVGVEVHSKILYACIHGDVFQETIINFAEIKLVNHLAWN